MADLSGNVSNASDEELLVYLHANPLAAWEDEEGSKKIPVDQLPTAKVKDFSKSCGFITLLFLISMNILSALSYGEMSRLTRDGTAEPVSRDQILRHARGQGNVIFSCSADHEQDWEPYPVDPYSAIICDDHTYIQHRMTRMTGPDCVVMCNLINTYIHTYIHTSPETPQQNCCCLQEVPIRCPSSAWACGECAD